MGYAPYALIMFNVISADLAAHHDRSGTQSFRVILVCQFGGWCCGVLPALVCKFFSLIYKALYKLVQFITRIELLCEVNVGKNFVIYHFGDSCRVRNDVVAGSRRVDPPCVPQIRNNLNISVNAKVKGTIRVGSDVAIGANAAALRGMLDEYVTFGVPAVVKLRCGSHIK